MRASSSILVLLVACAALILAACGESDSGTNANDEGANRVPPPPELVGLWETEKRNEQGLGHYILLRADGTVGRQVALSIDFDYTFDGTSVTVVDKSLDVGKEFTVPSTLRGDELLQQRGDRPAGAPGTQIRKERIALVEGGSDAIAGVYRYDSPAGKSYELFDGNGTMHLRIPQPAEHGNGTFTVEGDSIILEFEGTPAESVTYELDGDVLTMTTEDGSPKSFNRVPHGPWYVIEEEPDAMMVPPEEAGPR